MSGTDYKFEGWIGRDKSSADGNMEWGSYEPKAFEEGDVDIEVTHCGVCGSDVHMLRSGWGAADYPVVVGHEIVGKVVRVGSQVEGDIQLGDRVGVGAQSDSCRNRGDRDCAPCRSDEENYCAQMVFTFGAKYRSGDKSYGGFARHVRVPSHFAIKIPEGVASEDAAPMLCGGITTYSPLKHFGAGPGKTVAVVGLGGLGHFAVLWAKALGVEQVVGMSRRNDKRDDSLRLGCDEYIATAENENWSKKNAGRFDIILSTISSTNIDLGAYLALLAHDGVLVQVGLPDTGAFQLPTTSLLFRRSRIAGSVIGSPTEIREMFDLAIKKKVKAWVETRPMEDANQVIKDFQKGDVRYRYCLVNRR